jgi:Alpha/beta hydrolase family
VSPRAQNTKDLVVLLHSPLVGTSSWSPVASALRRRGVEVVVPALADAESGAPYWVQHRDAVAAELADRAGRAVVLVGHSGAGALLPAIAEALERPVSGYVFVDAGIPENGVARLELLARALPAAATELRALLTAGERFPAWSDDDLRTDIPDPRLRRRVLDELRPRALSFWTEPIPVFAGWPDAACRYLHFSPGYDRSAEEARRRGWSYRHLPGGHFHQLVDPAAVADHIAAHPGEPES